MRRAYRRHDPPHWQRPFVWRQVKPAGLGYWVVWHPVARVTACFPDRRYGGKWPALDVAFNFAVRTLYSRGFVPERGPAARAFAGRPQ